MSKPKLHLGYSAQEQAGSPYARFFNPRLAPLPGHVREALAVGALAPDLMPSVERAAELQAPGYWPVETGHARAPDGAVRVFVLTQMPGVTPAMWDWWFAWHGSDGLRYKLWHPQAHLDVAWADGRDDLQHYVGRTSKVVEYVGATRFRLAIRFIAPAQLGLDEQALKAAGEVAICARVGLDGLPFETAWLVHHVRPVAGGAEMRTRIWVGGDNIRPRGMPGGVGRWIGRLAGWLQPITPAQIHELIVHDAQEMNHLAAILPQLYDAFGPGASREPRT